MCVTHDLHLKQNTQINARMTIVLRYHFVLIGDKKYWQNNWCKEREANFHFHLQWHGKRHEPCKCLCQNTSLKLLLLKLKPYLIVNKCSHHWITNRASLKLSLPDFESIFFLARVELAFLVCDFGMVEAIFLDFWTAGFLLPAGTPFFSSSIIRTLSSRHNANFPLRRKSCYVLCDTRFLLLLDNYLLSRLYFIYTGNMSKLNARKHLPLICL